ncbi:hypothetical protein HO133_005590 [Letharia lupina]|uniref:Uncharacterized protein n=1 Tax=Letharia lupina TaxID=560253 RepID=A0A8H6C9A0_9LECA|nr:uncharacterized protein HO133_005590 [Letharia lupina]KAF6219046.1 hypothetical protein HO133_005590 [Letharia lupina]
MEVLNELFPKMGLECRGSIVFIHLACCDGDPNSFEVEHLKSAEPQDRLCSGVVHLWSGLVQRERGGELEYSDPTTMSYRVASAPYVHRIMEHPGIRIVLYRDQDPESVEQTVRPGNWREVGRDTIEAEEHRDRMISRIGPHLYVFEPIAESTAAVPVAGPSAKMQIRV